MSRLKPRYVLGEGYLFLNDYGEVGVEPSKDNMDSAYSYSSIIGLLPKSILNQDKKVRLVIEVIDEKKG